MKVWHQARLKFIPTAEYLYRIKCSEERFCKFDCSIETNEHFLRDCNLNNDIKAKGNEEGLKGKKVEELLSDRNDNKTKEKIALTILEKLKMIKTEIKKINNNEKALFFDSSTFV